MRLRCGGETQDAAESLAAYRAAGHSTQNRGASGVRPADTNSLTAKPLAVALNSQPLSRASLASVE